MDEFEADTQLRVFVRDLIDGDLTGYPAEDWLNAYAEGGNEAIELWQASLGGTIAVTGTPEQGRVTVNDADRVIVLDTQWWTVTVERDGTPISASATDGL
ncbi:MULTISPECIES: hypothetical protein [Tsukamurella]|uniref:Uncharacterized protein n=2 Tax=Tsukamurella TaxID=2060 RepID=A0A5C5RWV5_9ACTN|nr:MULTISPECIES: hypothetical protein [Tsukamurella]NMD55845.1 hypothetical protein [Tsukamurella columbiensis]TWS27537.1 hypothetical protein FK530_17525 [Tsukamurella conjunctivitidis]